MPCIGLKSKHVYIRVVFEAREPFRLLNDTMILQRYAKLSNSICLCRKLSFCFFFILFSILGDFWDVLLFWLHCTGLVWLIAYIQQLIFCVGRVYHCRDSVEFLLSSSLKIPLYSLLTNCLLISFEFKNNVWILKRYNFHTLSVVIGNELVLLMIHVNINARAYCYQTACRMCQVIANDDFSWLETTKPHAVRFALPFFSSENHQIYWQMIFTWTKWDLTIFFPWCFCSKHCLFISLSGGGLCQALCSFIRKSRLEFVSFSSFNLLCFSIHYCITVCLVIENVVSFHLKYQCFIFFSKIFFLLSF